MTRSLLLLPVLLLIACEPKVGGECTYEDLPGTCTFVDAAGGAPVTFDFASEDGAVTDSDTFTIGDGSDPDQACLDTLGITAGASFDCVQRTMTDGACTPVIYEFADFDGGECL
jgi:hypothetical protein